jgi:hypothetical protein
VNEAYSKWSHRITYHHGWVSGGHYSRARGAAWREAQRDLAKWGLSEEQVEYAIRQAYDVAKVERMYPE